jgi:Arc/MetJ family transcription regulator
MSTLTHVRYPGLVEMDILDREVWMAKTTIDVDSQKVDKAQEILGTQTIRDTVDAALRHVIAAAARREFIEIAASGAFAELLDPEVERQMWS